MGTPASPDLEAGVFFAGNYFAATVLSVCLASTRSI